RVGAGCARLPENAVISGFRLRAGTEGVALDGQGAGVRLAVRKSAGSLCVVEGGDGDARWRVVCCDHDLTAEDLADAAGLDDLVPRLPQGLAAGHWLVLPGPALVPIRGGGHGAARGAERDGLGRALPVRPRRPRPLPSRRAPTAVAGRAGFTVLAPAAQGAQPLGWSIGTPGDGEGVTVSYRVPPLSVTGTLAALPASPPYRTVLGGVLLVESTLVGGSAVGAYVVPGESGVQPSMFAFGALGRDKGIGPPPFQVRGIALGMGWNSQIRQPAIEEVADFPFVVALDDPGAIGGAGGDPVQVLRNLTAGDAPWVRPSEGGVWVAAGLAFSCFDVLFGRALAMVQTGADLTIALLGVGSAELPRKAGRKFAKAEIALEAVLKPNAGEMRLSAALTPASFVIDPNCKLRGGATLAVWYGPSPQAGDFVLSLGGYHPNYRPPAHYPVPARLGFDWDLTGSVTVSGSAYFAVTPSAVMLGGGLDVRFHSGMLRAWLTAKADALIQWRPFAFDIGVSVRIGVQARIKIIFVTLTITIEIGASLRLYGPPTGGEATVHLWFIEFTIGFGAKRDTEDNLLDWGEFTQMLPPPGGLVRINPGAGLISDEGRVGGTGGAWLVSSAGFAFTVDSSVPITEMYFDSLSTLPAQRGDRVGVRPMGERDRTAMQVVSLLLEGTPLSLAEWEPRFHRSAVPQSLWGAGSPSSLPPAGTQLIRNQLTGVELASPAADNGADTGYISAEHLTFDPLEPGVLPLDPNARPIGPIPVRLPGGQAIDRICTTVDATNQRSARAALVSALAAAGVDVGAVDRDLSGYARAAESAFTAAPLLVPVG
ncbi:hypothetical protein C1I98_30965, partial [Spongiactinospora gelatinilytica]